MRYSVIIVAITRCRRQPPTLPLPISIVGCLYVMSLLVYYFVFERLDNRFRIKSLLPIVMRNINIISLFGRVRHARI